MCKILKRVFYGAFYRVVYGVSYRVYIRSIGGIVYKVYPTQHSIIHSVGHCKGYSIGHTPGVFYQVLCKVSRGHSIRYI